MSPPTFYLPFAWLVRLSDGMTTQRGAYELLRERMQHIAFVGSATSLLSWDQETYMPQKALPFRAEQMAFLSGWAHHMFTSAEVGQWLSECEQAPSGPKSKEEVNVREWRRSYERQTKLPTSLVEELERVRSIARDAWVEARRRSDFSLFASHLEKIVQLNRQMADHWGYAASRYDALLEEFEPGTTAAPLRELFGLLRPEIVSLVGPATERSAAIPEDLLAGHYPVAQQQAFNREVAAALGFDFAAGRIDTTAHPFCTGLGPGDCRLTTRYNEKDFTQSLYGILHEAGHGLYDQGLSLEDFGTPMGSAVSLGIHESQSRLWENHVGRSRAFWEHWHAKACDYFPNLKRLTPLQITQAINRVRPSFIRVEADEVTYDLHIILRFQMELALIEGDIESRDVPSVWNESFQKMFDLKVPDDAHGCLQDIHWSMGSFGYFSTYTLGNLNASQLFRRATMDRPQLAAELAAGSYTSLLDWLREKVHQLGQRDLPQELMVSATGEPTQTRYHLEHLREKFL